MNDNDARVIIGTRSQLNEMADRISRWRTQRYIDAGFYDPAVVHGLAATGKPIETSRSEDYEIAVVDHTERILATLSLRRPTGDLTGTLQQSPRPRFGLESIHGTSFLGSLGPIHVERCWEAGRFLRDRSLSCHDAVVAVTTAAARLVADLAADGRADLLVGEVEPSVALRHLRAFDLPIALGAPRTGNAPTGLLAPRYAGRTVVPFALDLTAITDTHRRSWPELEQRRHLLEPAHAA